MALLLVVVGCSPTAYEMNQDATAGDSPWVFPDGPLADGQDAGVSREASTATEAGGDGPITKPDGTTSKPDGAVQNPDQSATTPDQSGTTPDAGCGIPSSCKVTFKYTNSSISSCELRGNFTSSSWSKGYAMTKSGSTWSVSLTLGHAKTFEYKFYLDGKTWTKDPNEQANAGAPNNNSKITVACKNPCSADGGVVSPDSGSTTSFDWRDGIMYFVLLDRFNNGDTKNDKPESGVKSPANWQGGDLAGLLAKLKTGYFTNLGVNVIWISSPVDAPDGKYIGMDKEWYTGYHGYWPTELTKVEERLGDLALLKSVVTEAHSRGIKVVMDYVMNHTHKNSSTYKNNSSWFYSLNYYGKNCVCGSGCSWDTYPENERCWFMDYLPDFDFTNSSARSFSVGNAIKWIKDTGVDGYRLDAVKHISMQWLTDLRSQVKTQIVKSSGKRFYMVGETFSYDKGTLKKYVDPNTKLDGQFDFPLRKEMARVILNRYGSFRDLDSFIAGNKGYYGSNSIMGTFIGNHDLPRAINLAEDTPVFNETASGKNKAWYGTPSQPSYDRPYQRLGVAFAALMTLPGVPLIYYGDEIGLAGGGDPDNRRFMQWSGYNSHQTALKTLVAKLTKIRSQNKPLRYGAHKEHWKDTNVYVYSMTYSGQHLVVVLNRSDSSQTVKPTLPKSGAYSDLISGKTGISGSITIGARSAMILK